MNQDVTTMGPQSIGQQLSALRARYLGDPRITEGLPFIFALEIARTSPETEPSRWVFCPGPPASVEESRSRADVTVVLSEETLNRILSGASSPQVEYLKGAIGLEGNAELALRLAPLLSSTQLV